MKKILIILTLALMIMGNVSVYAEEQGGIEIYVSPTGSATGDGTIQNPYRNLSSAITNALQLKDASEVTVILRGGRYYINNSLDFIGLGEKIKKFTLKGYEGEEAVISGGLEIDFKKQAKLVTDKETLSKIPDRARGKVYAVDLSDYRIDNYGSFGYQSWVGETIIHYKDRVALYYDSKRLTLARYPNFKWGITGNVTTEGDATAFVYDDKEIKNWVGCENAIVGYPSSHGYLYYFEKLISVDAEAKKIYIEKNSTIGPGRRWYIYNTLATLDIPGEYYIDDETETLYMIPPFENMDGNLEISALHTPMIRVTSSENVSFRNITLENTVEMAVSVVNSNNITFDGCTVRNVSGDGISITGTSSNVVVENSEIYNLGFNGIILGGACDLENLTPNGNVVRNCDIHNYALTSICNDAYAIKFDMNSLGGRVENNRIHDGPAIAVIYTTYMPYMGYNEVYNVGREILDNSAFYAGRRTWLRGSVAENNLFYDIHPFEGASGSHVYCLYADDYHAAVTFRNNIMYDCEYAMLLGGGSDNVVENNLMIDCGGSILYDNRGENWAKGSFLANVLESVTEVWKYDSFKERWPELNDYFDPNALWVGIPQRNVIKNNISLNSMESNINTRVIEFASEYKNNVSAKVGEYELKDPENHDFTILEGSKVLEEVPEFKQISTENIGMKNEAKRRDFRLIYPQNGQKNVEASKVEFNWEESDGHDYYRLIVAVDPKFEGIVIDEEVRENYYVTDKLKYNNIKYYWKVETVQKSKSDHTIPSESGVYTFTTKKEESRDDEALLNLVNSIDGKYENVAEGENAGEYQAGAVAELKPYVENAKKLMANSNTKQREIKKTHTKLSEAIQKFDNKINYNVTGIEEMLADKENWATNSESKPVTFTEDGGVYNPNDTNTGYKGKMIPKTDILKFKGKFDMTTWNGFGLNSDDPVANCWETTGYAILMKRDIFELQRYGSIGQNGILKIYTNEDIILNDIWYDIEVGTINTYDGVRIIFKVDGETIIDYFDKGAEAVNQEGYFAIYTSGESPIEIKPN